MDPLKDLRWRQRFQNFEKSFKLLDKYSNQQEISELERAGIIQLFEVTFELAWKVLKDYLDAQGYNVKSPREAIKTAFQIEIINNGHDWLEALNSRNLTTHTYDEVFAERMITDIKERYTPILKEMYDRFLKE